MNDWLNTALSLIHQNEAAVLVSVIGTHGSVPREAGTRMIVCPQRCHGTIGGGHLEYKAIALAHEILASSHFPDTNATLRRFPLGASLGQCCGGLVQLLFEPLNRVAKQWMHYLYSQHDAGRAVMMITQTEASPAGENSIVLIRKLLVSEFDHHGELSHGQVSALHHARQQLSGVMTLPDKPERSRWFEKLLPADFNILVFGAGHVGKALIGVLSTLPCHIRWIDSRDHEFPVSIPNNVSKIVADEPNAELAAATPGSYIIILTHQHALDERICAQALQNDTLAWCGLIGSATKRRKFVHRFRARGLSDDAIGRLVCPIGLPGLNGKHPGEIAISVAAQILEIRQQQLVRCHHTATPQHASAG